MLYIWQDLMAEPFLSITEHSAAVKALTWSQNQHKMLASGGGANDRKLRFFNVQTGLCTKSVDSGSQVCNIHWCKSRNEIISAHGFNTNEVILWNYSKLTPIATLTGHTKRILHFAVSHDENLIATGAADDTLRLWNIGRRENSHQGVLTLGQLR